MAAADKTKRHFRRWKVAAIIVSVLVLLLTAVIASLPLFARWAVIYSLEQQGYKVKIAQVDVDLLDGRLVGKTVTAKKPTGERLALDSIEAVIDWHALLQQQVQLLSLNVAGLRFDTGGTAKQAEPAADKQTDTTRGGTGWLLGLRSLTLKDGRICHNADRNKPCLIMNKLSWQGKAEFEPVAATTPVAKFPLQLNGKLTIAGLNFTVMKQRPLILLKQLSLRVVGVKSLANIQLKDIQLQQFSLPRYATGTEESSPPEYAKFKSLEINKAGIIALNRLELDKMIVTGLGGDAVRQADGDWQFVNHWQAALPQQQQSSADSAAKRGNRSIAMPQFSIKQLTIKQSDNIAYKDLTFETPFAISLQQLALSMTRLDSQLPNQSTGFELNTIVARHGKMDIRGNIYPFRDGLTFKLQGRLSGVDLRPATSYLERYLGYRVKSGQISSDFQLEVASGQLQGVANVELQQFDVTETVQQQASNTEQQQVVPFDSALSLLREKDKSIHLKIPISGDISDPQFSTDDAVKQIINKSVMQAVESYYTDYGLTMAGYGQYGLAVTGARKLFGFLTKLRFTPVKFDVGQDQLVAEQLSYLDNLAQMLIGRPEVHLKLCGYVTQADLLNQESWLASEPEEKWNLASLSKSRAGKLLQLANQRAATVKDYLVGQWSIKAQRLIVCEPQYDATTDKLPRVEISI